MNIHTAAEKGNLKRVKELLNQGVPVNSRIMNGFTPLHEAAGGGRLNVVRELLRRGAHVNPRTRGGFTPLHYALEYPRIVHALLKAGANPKYRSISTDQNAYNRVLTNNTLNALNTSRAASTWLKPIRKRKAERMLASPRFFGSTILNKNSIASIARYLTVRKKNNNK